MSGLDKFFVNQSDKKTTPVCSISEPAPKPPVGDGENQRLNSIQGKIDNSSAKAFKVGSIHRVLLGIREVTTMNKLFRGTRI